ncbi:hypothetical protein ILUMI_11054 [Ignelater luminosus]|uniref:LanC-like protein 3 homolog n=1 Tax=Ignelater luminosus TaxID=2038154 RepID=A0A8K0GD23_IGNLU|nr:hypothetical protein ILUMI_11054 [Ignelater luminosus]
MKRALVRFASSFFGTKQPQSKPTMASNRFFPNNMLDFDERHSTNLQIPEDHLTEQLRSMVEDITTNIKPVELNAEDGLYLGTAGIAYMFYHLSKIPALHEIRTSLLKEAVEYIRPSLAVAQKYANKKKDVPSFILGNCGIYAVASAVYKATGDSERSEFFKNLYFEAADICKEQRFLSCGSDELFVGRAGYICGALWLAKEINVNPPVQDLHELSRVMIASGREYAVRHQSPCPLMYAYYGVEYLGAAHGLCTILQVLLSVPGYLDANPGDAKDVKNCVDYLLSIQDAEGNFPSATDELHQKHELVHWCHGAPGMVYLMAKAYLVWHEDKYLQACEKMTQLVWNKGLLKKGPGICHGVAGSGYVFLLLYRLTNHTKYLDRAIKFAQFMETEEFKRHARIPDNPFSLYEGIAGTVCFLGDITAPSQAAFPFSDVF